MAIHRQEQQSVVVATAPTASEAEFVQMTLIAHGIEAVVSPRDLAHPSLDFVQGVRVSVRPEDVEAARALLGDG
jgi:hypothetical protein